MRIRRARFWGFVASTAAAVSLAVSLGMAQQTGGGTTGGTTAPGPGKGPSPPPTTPAPTPAPNTLPVQVRIWITGQVIMADGGPPPEPVTIERLCSANSIRPEGYTDTQGHFSLTIGQNNREALPDASTGIFDDPTQRNANTPGGLPSTPESIYWSCELRARLAGYRSTSVSLAGRRSMDTPDVGVIVLYPMAGVQGLTASATANQAPKDARKAYEKGLDAVKKGKPEQALQEFRKAVQIYPRHAAAWLELGKVLQQGDYYPEAREAYAHALEADSKFVYPYQQLYQIALREQNWKELADNTDQLLHLNPYEFPLAYYYNALAHHQMKDYDAAEKSARRAVEMDRRQVNPKTHYLLGAILVQKREWIAAADSFRAYLKAAPGATDKAQVEKTLGQLDQQIHRVQTASQDSAAQQ